MAWSEAQKIQHKIEDIQKQHKVKLIELYNNYYKKAESDTNAFKAFQDVSKELFKSTSENELEAILNNVKVDSDNDE